MVKIHIGKKIKSVQSKSKLTVNELAKAINRSRNVAYNVFTRESIDTGLLLHISKALNHDFFKYYSDQVKQ